MLLFRSCANYLLNSKQTSYQTQHMYISCINSKQTSYQTQHMYISCTQLVYTLGEKLVPGTNMLVWHKFCRSWPVRAWSRPHKPRNAPRDQKTSNTVETRRNAINQNIQRNRTSSGRHRMTIRRWPTKIPGMTKSREKSRSLRVRVLVSTRVK